ncbi:MAG: dipeptide epimerase [Alphaproteobacteria bacterium]|nr:dipeptide epimerase [Alphaproteobacteria bacterium]|tara:strand:- start:17250 stop:18314 length:1065 start_codon:yes stop_codon:yes gene_type:complete
MTRLSLHIRRQPWTLAPPFIIAGEAWSRIDSLVVELTDRNGCVGRSETQGVSYRGETFETISQQIESVREQVENGLSMQELQYILPAGGARNALDVALWELASARQKRPVHSLLGLETLAPVETVYTVGLKSAADAAAEAARQSGFHRIKIKADADHHIDAVAAIRAVRPDAKLIVDANQSWSLELLKSLAPELKQLEVSVIEQPLPETEDEGLEGYSCPVLLMADESCQDCSDLPAAARRYDAINIKLDKTGGLTEAMRLYNEAARLGLKTMVGNMCGGSLAMAPAYLIAQWTDFADLDGPLLQTNDWPNPLRFQDGWVCPPEGPLWGDLHLASTDCQTVADPENETKMGTRA